MKRVHYFNGQLLTAADFQTEQDYHLAKERRINLRTGGPGVVSGLGVSIESDGGHVVVRPGVAIDRLGREIVLDTPQLFPLPDDATHACRRVFLQLSYTETLTDPAGQETPSTRIEEGFKLAYASPHQNDLEDGEQGITLAAFTKIHGRWALDRPSGSLWKIALLLLVIVAVFRRR